MLFETEQNTPNDTSTKMSETRKAAPTKKKSRRLSFADEQPGRAISEVEYCDNLHYSDPAQQVQFDESGNPATPKASASCCIIS